MKLLWVGDAACDSGFSRCTHGTIDGLIAKGWEAVVLGINYRGDPHNYPYKIYPAYVHNRDLFGVKRLPEMIARVQPDVVVLQNDPWNIPAYIASVSETLETIGSRPALVGAIAVDGKNCRGFDLNGLDHVIFWTRFAKAEAERGSYTGTSSVIPLGVDLDMFSPAVDEEHRKHEWQKLQLPEFTSDGFFFLNVNRNQPRKHLELTFAAFAEFLAWWKVTKPGPCPYLYLHICPTGEQAIDPEWLGQYYGLKGHLIVSEPGVFHGASEEDLLATYRRADVMITTTQGEGWGLPTMEGMACGVPQIVPNWSALGEWTQPAARLVQCNSITATPKAGVIGGLVDIHEMVDAMKDFYVFRSVRSERAQAGLELVKRPEFRWSNIGARFDEELRLVHGRLRCA